ncbi:hypothetical protein [Rubellicoccus peritrichatus]|uniref:Uncharacterized protein n=1 Tax=Rubellicoccus peritrichatus TaxID=3080537 RepID=A0AAQ3LAM8_9BACT|nr:hypothetical protein [Puniceicoccus sp. CR14]WOO42335.1 hypothetical protein RZN69_04480 [Puniceicoccus sp. CR14]
MREAINLVAATVAVGIACWLGWLAVEMNTKEEKVEQVPPKQPSPPPPEPQIPRFRVNHPDLSAYQQAPPEVVLSRPLPRDMKMAMNRQIQLFTTIMGMDSPDDPTEKFQQDLNGLRNAFPEVHEARGHGYWRSSYRSYKTINGVVYYSYYYPIYRSTNEQMVDDFRHTVKNAQLDEVDFVIRNLGFKKESWVKRLENQPAGYTSDVQQRADRAFLSELSHYIGAWQNLKEQIETWHSENPDKEMAKTQWALFEKNELPNLNAYIGANTTDRWQISEDQVVEAKIPNRSTLYLRFNIAGRELHFPLQPAWHAKMPAAIIELPPLERRKEIQVDDHNPL